MGAKYIGTRPGLVRVGNLAIQPNDTISGPADIVAYLLKRADFVEADGGFVVGVPSDVPDAQSFTKTTDADVAYVDGEDR